MEVNYDYVLSELYCVYCYELFKTKTEYDGHLPKCREENTIEPGKDAEGDIYFK